MESSEGWREVFRDIKRRGVSNILMIIADGIQHLENVVREEFPGTKLQKCLVHKIRSILLKVRNIHKERNCKKNF
jgi:Transposase and inactivated derivatives